MFPVEHFSILSALSQQYMTDRNLLPAPLGFYT